MREAIALFLHREHDRTKTGIQARAIPEPDSKGGRRLIEKGGPPPFGHLTRERSEVLAAGAYPGLNTLGATRGISGFVCDQAPARTPQEVIAQRIIAAARTGERDFKRLRHAALAGLRGRTRAVDE